MRERGALKLFVACRFCLVTWQAKHILRYSKSAIIADVYAAHLAPCCRVITRGASHDLGHVVKTAKGQTVRARRRDDRRLHQHHSQPITRPDASEAIAVKVGLQWRCHPEQSHMKNRRHSTLLMETTEPPPVGAVPTTNNPRKPPRSALDTREHTAVSTAATLFACTTTHS